jgi:outer membrane protein assembly factor BamB
MEMKTGICFILLVSTAFASPVIHFEVDTLKFGAVSAGGNHERFFEISNTGDEALVISHVRTSRPVFNLLAPNLPDTIESGDTAVYNINFHPQNEGTIDTVIIFNSNDPTTPNASLPIKAKGIPAFAPGEIIWSYQGIENVVSCIAMNDINNDGFPDVVAESYDAGASGNSLLCISGSGYQTGNLIWGVNPGGSGGYGDQCLIAVDDMNRNGTEDIILGTAWGSRSIYAIEGTTGHAIWTYSTNVPGPSGWVYSVASLGDINNDSIPEIIAGVGSDGNEALCLNGATGAKRWKYWSDDVIYSVCRIDDINNDAIPDAVLGGGDNDDAVYCISGVALDSARTIWTYHTGGSVQSLARIADLNDDGYNDVIAGMWGNGNHVIALSGHATGSPSVIWNVPIGYPVMEVKVTPDLNGDGIEDVIVASWASYTLALSGANGSELWRNNAGNDVWAVHCAYDVTGDSIPEIISGSFSGSVILINGATGETIWNRPTDAKIFTVRPIGDVNGDSIPDIIAGQQMISGVGGKIFLISGGSINPDAINPPNETLPEKISLLSNYPNPFNMQTRINYYLGNDGHVILSIYDLLGRKVASLFEGELDAGEHSITWDASGHTSGIYFIRLDTNDKSQTHKMTLLK